MRGWGIKLLLLPLPLPLLLQFLLGLELQEVLSDLRLSPQVAAPILEWQVSLCLFEHVEDMAWLLCQLIVAGVVPRKCQLSSG